jgi:hypothetical protein
VTTLGRYRHFKGHEYEVLGRAKDSETSKELGIAYIRLDAAEAVVWVRPEAMFDEKVEGVSRFMKLSDETWRGERMDCAENHYTAEEGRALDRRIKDLEQQLHEPGYVDALRTACEEVSALVPKEFRKQLQNEELDQLEMLPDLVGKYITSLTEWSEDDKDLPEDRRIVAAHPVETGDHELYMEALRMVTAKRSKYALVDLVNWLLARLKVSEGNQKGR